MIVSIIAPIAAGKTTFINLLQKDNPCLIFIPEPLEELQNAGGENLLSMFYRDKQRYSLVTEIAFLVLRAKKLRDVPCGNGIFLIERDPISCHEIFSKTLLDEGVITPMEWDVLLTGRKSILPLCPKIDKMIYLRCPLSVLKSRLQKRGRSDEKSLMEDDDYQLSLISKCEEFIASQKKEDVLILDVSENFIDSPEVWRKIHDSTMKFLE